jgi:sigma-54 specific flagellar transcriptional regulator A
MDVERHLALPSAGMREVVHMVNRVAPSGTTVFINGPSGSGKEFVARAIHLLSKRSNGPFVPVNCGAIPRDLIEGELFGSEKGAFTGSIKTRQGLMEIASGGTLFLDEIGDMPHDMQVKMLRVLEERSFTRLGGDRSIKADLRIVCATHRDLDKLVETGAFREDLYYRINVFPIGIAALDDRPEDVPPLVELILERFREQGFLNVPRLRPDAVAALQAAAWPGNVRQLRNVLERAGVLYGDRPVDASMISRLVKPAKRIDRAAEAEALWEAAGELAAADGFEDALAKAETAAPSEQASAPIDDAIDEAIDRAFEDDAFDARPAATADTIDVRAVLRRTDKFSLKDYMAEMESDFIRIALEDAGGSVSGAARILGFQRTTLIEKIRKFAIDRNGTERLSA